MLAALCVLSAVLVVGVSVSGASKKVTGAFGSAGSEAGQFGSGAPGAVAVNQTGAGSVDVGDVYVVDSGNRRIDEFSASGSFVRAFGLDVNTSGSGQEDICTEATTCVAGTYSVAAGALEGPTGIAVDQASGTVYVSDKSQHRVDTFSATGIFEGAFGWDVNAGSPKAELQLCTIATTCKAGTAGPSAGEIGNAGGYIALSPTGDLYLADTTNMRVDEFAPKFTAGELSSVSFVQAFGWDVDAASPKAELQRCTTVSGCKTGTSGAGLGQFGSNAIEGIAIDKAGMIYVLNKPFSCQKTNPCRVQRFSSTATTVSEFAPQQLAQASVAGSKEAVNQIAVDESDGHVLAVQANADGSEWDVLEFDGEGTLITTDGVGDGLPASTGLAVGDDAASLYFAETTHSEIHILQRIPHPSVGALFATGVTATSASIDAEIGANGAPTDYYFQYGTANCAAESSACADVQMPPGVSIGEGEGEELVSAPRLQGLLPATLYHYRVVASNGTSSVEAEATFTTQRTQSSPALPDGRIWERVSPQQKNGATIEYTLDGGDTRASADGGAFAYYGTAPLADAEGYNGPERAQYLSVRGPEGWKTSDIGTAHGEATPIEPGYGGEYRMFSTDLSRALVEPVGETLLSPLASEYTPYIREGLSTPSPTGCENPCYLPLLTTQSVATGVEFGPPRNTNYQSDAHFAYATPDLNDVILTSTEPLTEASTSKGLGGETNLYEWTGGHLQLVSITPAGQDITETGDFAVLGGNTRQVAQSVSSDGSRVAWASVRGHMLYLRDLAREETIAMNENHGGSGGGVRAPEFQTGSADLGRVFFTDTQQLTPDATTSNQLYAFELTNGPGEPLTGQLTDLTPGNQDGEAPAVQGYVLGESEDGRDVYFVANGVLEDAGPNDRGDLPVPGENSLYMRHYDAASKSWEEPVFIATLSTGDTADWQKGTEGVRNSARVSPNGRYLAFMSQRPLTGYDNHDATSAEPDEEVFLYDAQSNRLVCASCNPTGGRPHGLVMTKHSLLDESRHFTEGQWFAAALPDWIGQHGGSIVVQQPRYLSDSGRLFFDSADALVPQDTNGAWDAYEYELPGVGDCSSASTTFHAGVGGCVGLISSGTFDGDSVFMEASETGRDVFFLTGAKLVSQDADTALDVYDAHECAVSSPCSGSPESSPPCTTTDSCRAAAQSQPPFFGAAGSETLSGSGNLRPARKRATKRGRACRRPRGKRSGQKRCRRHAHRRRHYRHRKSHGGKQRHESSRPPAQRGEPGIGRHAGGDNDE